MGQQFSQRVPQQIQSAIEDLDRLESVAEFADTQATRRGDEYAAGIADALKDVAHLQKEFMIEENPLTQEFSQCSQQLLQQGSQQLQQYQQPEMQELADTAGRALESVTSGIQSMPTGGHQQGQR